MENEVRKPLQPEVRNAIILDAHIAWDRGWLTGWLDVDLGGGQKTQWGGLSLFKQNGNAAEHMGFMGHWVDRVLRVVGVGNWSQVRGKAIRVGLIGQSVVKVGHVVDELWFDPSVEFLPAQEWNKKLEAIRKPKPVPVEKPEDVPLAAKGNKNTDTRGNKNGRKKTTNGAARKNNNLRNGKTNQAARA